MAKVIAGMTMSLEGFVEDADGSADALYPDLAQLRDVPRWRRESAPSRSSVESTSPVSCSRRAWSTNCGVDVMPVLLGDGLRLFDRTGPLALEKLGIDEVGARTSLRFHIASSRQ